MINHLTHGVSDSFLLFHNLWSHAERRKKAQKPWRRKEHRRCKPSWGPGWNLFALTQGVEDSCIIISGSSSCSANITRLPPSSPRPGVRLASFTPHMSISRATKYAQSRIISGFTGPYLFVCLALYRCGRRSVEEEALSNRA